ncbi:hypothetical protein BDW02DRAFT_597194 [Decorospora gaudefroyi]|uniref:Uncharacterized protein n=1 Tax=Decorospora gaudefroyi TaxID=184978 RepID=A0A6A5KEC0_9PLEO|nr:hypothetical protein BDW02DRAFT_597194 [Decorospora gaudefroyi]
MTTPTNTPALPSIALAENVYEQDFEFRSTIRMVFDMMDSSGGEDTLHAALEVFRAFIGTDPVKLYGLIDVLLEKVMSHWDWASNGAVSFCMVLFGRLDLEFLENDVLGGERPRGDSVLAGYIMSKFMRELDDTADWRSHNIVCLLEFIDKSFERGATFMTLAGVANVIEKMIKSPSLLFECYKNLEIFLEFFLLVITRNVPHDAGDTPLQLKKLFDELCRVPEASAQQVMSMQQLLQSVGWTVTKVAEVGGSPKLTGSNDHHDTAPVTVQNREERSIGGHSIQIFNRERDWGCMTVRSMIEDMVDRMVIGALDSVQVACCDMIEAMVKSDKIFVRNNLTILIVFLTRVGPALDGAADTPQSHRLTELLEALESSTLERTTHQRGNIEVLLRCLRRT